MFFIIWYNDEVSGAANKQARQAAEVFRVRSTVWLARLLLSEKVCKQWISPNY